jgi:hypothetical protein
MFKVFQAHGTFELEKLGSVAGGITAHCPGGHISSAEPDVPSSAKISLKFSFSHQLKHPVILTTTEFCR